MRMTSYLALTIRGLLYFSVLCTLNGCRRVGDNDGETLREQGSFSDKYAKADISDRRDRLSGEISAEVPNSEFRISWVYSTSYCGSGGCTLLIYREIDGREEIVGDIRSTNLPISYLGEEDGFPVFGVTVRGGGILKPFIAEVSANDGIYPMSPFDKNVERTSEEGITLIGREMSPY